MPCGGMRGTTHPSAKRPDSTGSDPSSPGRPLRAYESKRRFERTPEPAPAPAAGRSGPLLFVVQQHAARRMHWDFRLELDGVLKSWAVPKAPSLDPADKRLAVLTEDHPFDYASFEGVIPHGQYGAGEVIVWDCGVYSPDEAGETSYHDRDAAQARLRNAFEKGKLSIELRGEKLNGSWTLVRTRQAGQWFLIKHRDRFVSQEPPGGWARSVLSGLEVEALRQSAAKRGQKSATGLTPDGPPEAFPTRLMPMLAEVGRAPFAQPDWLYEPKLDGYRAMAFLRDGRVTLRSRRGLDLSKAFPRIVEELSRQGASMVLDGEVVALGSDGRPSFSVLQERAQLKQADQVDEADRTHPALFYCFDLLHFAGANLRAAPYEARHRYLAQCLWTDTHVKRVDAHEDGEALLRAALSSGFEGVMAKRRSARYLAGKRSGDWLKIKSTLSAEFLIGGYSRGKGARAALGSLLVGYRDATGLRYAAHVGTGFDAAMLERLQTLCNARRRKTSPFSETPPRHGETVWVEPELVAEVRFAEWTPGGSLRAPVFLRLREDVDPAGVTRPASSALRPPDTPAPAADRVAQVLDQLDAKGKTLELDVGGERVRVTNLDRVYWPAAPALRQPPLTKRDLLRYLAAVSPYMLPHLADRPLTMIRFPQGIGGERFFQKHWEQKRPAFVESVQVYSESKAQRDEYLLCNNLPTLLWLAQAGTLEFHVWHSRARTGPDTDNEHVDYASSLEAMERSLLNFPDYLVFDIDPYIYSGKEKAGDEPELNDVAFAKGKEVAFHLRALLQEMKLEPIVKTSGKTGLHVFVPIERHVDFDATRRMSEAVGLHLMREHPQDITMEWSVRKRTGKIFMDYNMNVRGKTLNVAYSPRALAGAAVSMPLTWEELADAHPLDFRMMEVPARLARTGDVWHDALRAKQSLERALGISAET